MYASLKNYRQSPRKVRLVADAIRGKKVADARTILTFMPKRAAKSIKKLLDSAIANAAQKKGGATDTLTVERIEVNKGLTMKRIRPRARGSAFPIHKHTSHVSITLGEKK